RAAVRRPPASRAPPPARPLAARVRPADASSPPGLLMPIRLHVNVDHVATLRQARGTTYPDPVYAAQVCESAGADGITIHLREDRRHIVDRDVARMRE